MWFLWEGATILMFSLPNTRKLRDLVANSAVVLTLEAADPGYDVVILEGRAALLRDPAVTGMMSAIVAKYADMPRRWPPNEWAGKFSQPIRVTPIRLTSWVTKPGRPAQHRAVRF
jgi:hypothetical protein